LPGMSGMGRGLLSVRTCGGRLALGNVHLESPVASVKPETRRAQLELCTALLTEAVAAKSKRALAAVAVTKSPSIEAAASTAPEASAADGDAGGRTDGEDHDDSGGGGGGDDDGTRWFLLGDFNFTSDSENPGIPESGAVDLWETFCPGEEGFSFDFRVNANCDRCVV
jgi:hypothetical protein